MSHMKPEIKAKWVAALRSGEYRQGRNVLKQAFSSKDTPQFCCLGVLCDLAVKDGLEIEVVDVNDNDPKVLYKVWSFDGAEELLPKSVIEWAGIESTNGNVAVDGSAYGEGGYDVASLNDNGVPFIEIADVIEKSL